MTDNRDLFAGKAEKLSILAGGALAVTNAQATTLSHHPESIRGDSGLVLHST